MPFKLLFQIIIYNYLELLFAIPNYYLEFRLFSNTYIKVEKRQTIFAFFFIFNILKGKWQFLLSQCKILATLAKIHVMISNEKKKSILTYLLFI